MTPQERSEYIETIGKSILFYRPKDASDNEIIEAVLVVLQITTNMAAVAAAIDYCFPKTK